MVNSMVRLSLSADWSATTLPASTSAEDVTDGRTGFLIEENAASMAALLKELLSQRETVGRVGERAQEEIYISWDSAVKNAYDRYGAVVERYRCGGYPCHDTLTDDFFHGMATVMNVLNRGRSAQQQLLEEMRSGYDGLMSGLSDGRRRWSELLEEYLDRFL